MKSRNDKKIETKKEFGSFPVLLSMTNQDSLQLCLNLRGNYEDRGLRYRTIPTSLALLNDHTTPGVSDRKQRLFHNANRS